MRRRRTVVTGIGPITCIGTGVDNFWNAIQAEKSGIQSITSFDPSVFHVRCAGEIRDWNAEEYFSPHRLKRLDRYAQFAVVSAKLALEDARIEYAREKPQDRVGVSFGTALGGVCKAEEQYIRYLKKGARGVQPTLAVQVFGGSAHSNIAIVNISLHKCPILNALQAHKLLPQKLIRPGEQHYRTIMITSQNNAYSKTEKMQRRD